MAENEKNGPANGLVVRHNKLIESRHRMTMAERRFVLWNISQVNREDTSFKPYEIGVREYFDVLGLKQIKDPYQVVKRMHDRLTQRNIGIEYTDGDGKPAFVYYPWFSELRYEDGKIYSRINTELTKYLLQLKEEFTSMALEQAMILDGFYTGRMFDLLVQYKKIGFRTLGVEFIRDRFGIADKYKKFGSFCSKVIDPAMKEINEKTDLEVSYELVKTGRKYTAFDFTIRTSRPTVTLEGNREEQEEDTKKLFNKLVRLGLMHEKARELIAQYSNSRICWHVQEYESKKRKGETVRPGWLVSGIEADYRPQQSPFDEELRQKNLGAEQHRQNREDYERLKSVLAGIDRLKRISDRKTIAMLYEEMDAKSRERMEQTFLETLEHDFEREDFLKNKWNALSCIGEIRRHWYPQYGKILTDIADIAREQGLDYRKTIQKIADLKAEIKDYNSRRGVLSGNPDAG